MKLQVGAVASTVVGVILAGVLMYYLGKAPILMDARRGFDGNVK
jgi:hypothetical protein